MAGVGKSMAGIGASLGIGIGIAAVTSLTRNAFDMAAALDESAQKMGVTVESLQELNLAAEQSGVSQETLAASMAKLNRSMGDLQLGKKGAVDAFAAIGLAAEDLKGKSPDEALRIIADRLNALPSVQERVAIGAQLMGRGFSQLLPLINQGSAGLEKYAETSRKNGQITTEEAKRLDELSDSWDRLKTRMGVATAKIIAGADNMVISFWKMRDGVTQPLDAMVASFWALRDKAIAAMGAMVTGIRNAIANQLNVIWEKAKEKIEQVKNKFKDLYDKVVGNSYVPDMVQEIGQVMGDLGRVMVDPALSATQKVGAAFLSLQSIIADVFGMIFGKKAGAIAGSLMGLVGSLASIPGLFGGGAATQGFVGPAMARGGSGVFGGRGGIDRNLLSLNGSPIARVSRGEHFSVSPANQNMAKVHIIPSPYFNAVVDGRAVAVAVPLAGQAAISGAAGAGMRMANQQRRQIP